MTYKLVITKRESNPLYDAEFADKAAHTTNFGYNGVTQYQIDKTRLEDESTVLQVELTEEEYKRFKQSALEIK